MSLNVNQRGHRNDSFVLVRFVSLRRANEACNKHPVRTIVEAETHFVLLYALRSWPTSSSNGIAACNRAGELFEPRVVGSNQGKWLGKCERSVWAVVQPNWVWASIEIDCRKSSLFFCLFYICMVYIVAYKSVL